MVKIGIICLVVLLILLCIAGISLYIGYWSGEAYKEMAVLNERFRELPPCEGMSVYRHYEYSFLLIARHAHDGKRIAFQYAYQIGYLTGKGDNVHE